MKTLYQPTSTIRPAIRSVPAHACTRAASTNPEEQSWQAFTATLAEADHRRLIIALGAGLREARLASAVATENGSVTEARAHVATALAHLTDALTLLQPPPAT